MRFACSLEVKRLKMGVFQLKDLPDMRKTFEDRKACFIFLIFEKNFLKST